MDAVTEPTALVFDKFIRKSILKEGGGAYTNDPLDKGGPTKWGITEARARAAGYTGDMQDMTFDTAYAIYRLFFWTQPMFDQICLLKADLAEFMLDVGINRGPHVPGAWLQRCCNVLNRSATDYADITVDGACGAMTRQSLRGLLKVRGTLGGIVLMQAMRALAAVDYIQIAEKTPTQERFEFGWLSQRAFDDV